MRRPGPGPRRPHVQLAPDLDHDLGHIDRAPQQIDPAPTQPGQLADAQPAVGSDQDQRPVARADHVGQAGDLGRVQEPHLLPLDLGQPHRPARRAGHHVGVDRRRHPPAEEW
jgi:hypothetical protein